MNATHDAARAMMDVKLRSLISLGLNEQALHLWFELFCSSTEVAAKWYTRLLLARGWNRKVRGALRYQPWSFVRSPGWVQIKCEVRLLAQFPFNLNPDLELPPLSDTASAKVAAKLAGVPASQALADRVLSIIAWQSGRMSSMPEKPLREGVRDMLVKHHLFSWRL